MSIKLFNGFLITAESAEQVLTQLSELKQQLTDHALSLALKHVAKSIVFAGDHHTYFMKEGEVPNRVSYFMSLIEELNELKATQRRNPSIDYGFEISLAPLNQTHWIALPFSEHTHGYMDIVQSMPWYTPYGYWNNTDKPDDLSEEEWEERYQSWNRVMGPTWVPSDKMFGYTLIKEDFILTTMSYKLTPFAPTHEQRVENLLSLAVSHDAMKDVTEKEFMDRFWYISREYKPDGELWPLRDVHMESVMRHVNDTPVTKFLISS